MGTPNVENAVVGSPNVEKTVVGTPIVENAVVGTPNVENAVVGTPNVESAVVGTPNVESAVVGTPNVEKTVAGSAKDLRRHFGRPGLGIQLTRPVLPSGESVTGANKRQWKKVTKRRRRDLQMKQRVESCWTSHDASFTDEISRKSPCDYRGGMCPSNLALHHPAADLLQQYSTEGCPVDTGRHWTREEIVAAIERGNHPMEPSAMQQFHDEALAKQERGLVEIIDCQPSSRDRSEQSRPSVDSSNVDTSATDARLALRRSLQLSQPLARRFPWSADTIR